VTEKVYLYYDLTLLYLLTDL